MASHKINLACIALVACNLMIFQIDLKRMFSTLSLTWAAHFSAVHLKILDFWWFTALHWYWIWKYATHIRKLSKNNNNTCGFSQWRMPTFKRSPSYPYINIMCVCILSKCIGRNCISKWQRINIKDEPTHNIFFIVLCLAHVPRDLNNQVEIVLC